MNLKNITLVILATTIATNGFGQFTSTLIETYQTKTLEKLEKNKNLKSDPAQREAIEALIKNSVEVMVNLYTTLAEKFNFQDDSLAKYEEEICEASVLMYREATKNTVDAYIEKIKKFASYAQKNSQISRSDLSSFLGLSTSIAMNAALPEKYSATQMVAAGKTMLMFAEKLNKFFTQEFGDIIKKLQEKAEAANLEEKTTEK